MKDKVITFTQTRRLFMKRNALVGALVTMIVAGGSSAVLAGHAPGAGFGDFPPGIVMGSGAFEERMAKILKLTETQKALIKDIIDAERSKTKPLFEKMLENRKLLMQAADANVFDEAAVRTIAVGQAKVEAELIISRTRVHKTINALLTPEQREIEKNLRPDMHFPPDADEQLNSQHIKDEEYYQMSIQNSKVLTMHRQTERHPWISNGVLIVNDSKFECFLNNISIEGALVSFQDNLESDLHLGVECKLKVIILSVVEYECKVVHISSSKVGLKFLELVKLHANH